jgi:nicotinamidase-related amidase
MSEGTRNEGKTALLVIDMLNPYDHEDAEKLAENVKEIVPGIQRLLERAAEEDTEVIYVNDNYGDWDSSREKLAKAALDGRHPELVEPILPPDGSKFVLKARHTIFYMSPLEYLLYQDGIDRLVMTGQVTEQCILYSALDAYVRHLQVAIPRDAVAPIYEDLGDAALAMMERNMHAELSTADEVPLSGGAASS